MKVRMLGEFSVEQGDRSIHTAGGRSNKVWLLMAYLICNRERQLPRENLLKLIGREESDADHAHVLRTCVWKARTLLSSLFPGEDVNCILSRDGAYSWNPEVPVELDTERFESLCRDAFAEQDHDRRQMLLRQAAEIGHKEFLAGFSSPWVGPLAMYYHDMYLNVALELLPLLEADGCTREAAELCRTAIRTAPYNEQLHRHLMRSLAQAGDFDAALSVYRELHERLYTELGVIPDEETQSLYQEYLEHTGGAYLPPDVIREKLREQTPADGAMICDFSAFKLFYRAEARAADRRGDAIHIGLLSVVGRDGKELSRRSMERAMEQLCTHIRESLRIGDIAARCSASQFVLMLMQANYENSILVCQRVARRFSRDHSRSPAKLQYSVIPLEPIIDLTNAARNQ